MVCFVQPTASFCFCHQQKTLLNKIHYFWRDSHAHLASLLTNNEHSRPIFSHRWKAFNVLNEDVLVLPLGCALPQCHWLAQATLEPLKCHWYIPEQVQHAHAKHNDQETPDGAHDVHAGHGKPLLEEDDGGGEDHGGEAHIVDGVDQQSVKSVQRLVQVVHLCNDGAHQRQEQDPGEWVAQDGQVGEDGADGNAKALDRGHSEGPQQGADHDVHQDVGRAPARGHIEDEH